MLLAMAAFMPMLLRPPALVHIHIASGPSFWRKLYFIALARARRIPILLHVHAGQFNHFYQTASPFKQALIRFALASAQMIYADLTTGKRGQ